MQQENVRRGNNRSTRNKGIAALAIGGLLLAGGGGTLAYWSTQESVGIGTINTGNLDLDLGTGEWTLKGVMDTAAVVVEPADVSIVPGDILTLTQPLTVTLEGDTIEADLSVDTSNLTTPLPTGVTVDLVIDGAVTGNDGVYRLTPRDVIGPLAATVTINFSGATENQISTDKNFDLSEIAFSLVQAAN